MTKQPPRSKIHLFFETRSFSLRNRTSLKSFIENIIKSEGKKLRGLNYIFMTDDSLLKINRDFLHHDYYTDIISFDNSDKHGVEGEIYISIDRVRDNASELGISFTTELLRVMFHGTLHLCGYKDKKRGEIRLMRQKEDHYLANYIRMT